jgi:hypothetical protein
VTVRKKASLALLVPVGAIVCFYALAIVIRQFAAPLYVNTFYKHSVENEFAASFNDFNNELKSLGLTQYRSSGFDTSAKTATCYNHVTDGGQNGRYEGFSETVPCIKQISIDPFVPDDEFIATWRAGSYKLLPVLKANGWKMTRNLVAGSDLATDPLSQQSIAKIFDIPNRTPAEQYATEIDYSKTDGKLKCSISLSYANNGPSPVKSLWLDESCERDVSFFGGAGG